ncbi:transporter substrate-binding domain-containing protein [Kiloniella sp.]|uniref:transporter substrate-binding domain-containing protein n=1 Tax=Kiloniella sp. TaxID=1938587 RepID=UPI003B02305C
MAAPSLLVQSTDNYSDDLKGLIEKRTIRVLVNYSPTNFFIVGGKPRGFEYDLIEEFRKNLKKITPKTNWPIIFIYKPVAFSDLLPLLESGYGDVAVGGLTITAARQESVTFTKPYLDDVAEVIVSSAKAHPIKTIDDMAGRSVLINMSSSFAEHLKNVNSKLISRKLEPIKALPANEKLTDEDILQMVSAGIVDYTVADLHVAQIWQQALPSIKIHEDIVLNDNGRLAWAVRKDNPELLKVLNSSLHKVKKGSLLGNIYFKKYFEQTKWIENPLNAGGSTKLNKLRLLFETYGEKYEIDWLALAALGYQESKLDQSVKSNAGAVGIMQVLPSTAAGDPINIPNVEKLEPNIHAGTKYLAHLRDRYFDDPEIDDQDRLDFMLAAYNAGPNKVQSMRKEAAKEGLDPNKWFSNVEQIARRVIGRETVDYVANITKYYSAYRLAVDYHRNDKTSK